MSPPRILLGGATNQKKNFGKILPSSFCVVKLFEVCKIIDLIPPYGKDFRDVYLVMKQMDVDLHRVIYSSQKLAHNHIKYFTYQIVKAMNYIHSSGIVHRDLVTFKQNNCVLH